MSFKKESIREASVQKKLLVLDTSYSLEDIENKGIMKSVTCRDLDGYFSRVWTVHPFATLVTSPSWSSKYGKPQWHELNSVHSFVEGKIGRYSWLKKVFPVNFLLGQIGLLFSLRKLVKKENISVIRVGDMLYLGLFGWMLSRLCKVPFVVRVGGNHDKVFETTGQPMQKRLFFTRGIEKKVERFVLSRADLVAGANQDNLNFALANGATKEKSAIFRYGNLLYEGHFTEPAQRQEGISLLEKIGITPGSFLLYIGRLEKVKHPEHIIKVLAYLRQNGHEVKALVVGEGSMLSEMKSIATELGVGEEVVFAGNQSQEWLARIIPLTGILISPHTGRALSEAALGEVAVVAYDIDWQAEIIEDGVTGKLVPHPDLQAMSEAAKFLLDHPLESRKLARALRLRAIDMLDPGKLNENEMSYYDALLHRNSALKN